MNLKKLILSTLIGGLCMWIIAGIYHNLIIANLYEETQATHEGLGILLVAYFILALIMAYIYPLGYRGKSPAIEGLRFGIIIGLLWVFPHGLAMAGAHGESIIYVFKNSAWHMVEQGLRGVIIGLIYGKN